MNTLQMLEQMDRDLASNLPWADKGEFYISKAILFGIEQFPPTNYDKVIWRNLAEFGDVYDLLDGSNKRAVTEASYYNMFGVITCGWAAPIEVDGDTDTRPSEHPEKKRVRLILLCEEGEIFSLIRFEDDDTVITDLSGRGELANAVSAFYRTTRKVLRDRREKLNEKQ